MTPRHLVHRAGLVLRTVRYLRPLQVRGLLLNRLVPHSVIETADLPIRLGICEGWKPGIPKHEGYLGNGRFRFLNRESTVQPHSPWWGDEHSYLWYYNLNYFEWINQARLPGGSDAALEWIGAWIAANPAGSNRAWDPYPVSLRIVNWIRFANEKTPLPHDAQAALAYHARWLFSRIEYHLLANHYLLNGIALLFAGRFFEGEEAGGWYDKGREIVLDQLAEQIHTDGGHFERCPMYQALILEDLLNLANHVQAYPGRAGTDIAQALARTIPRMMSWLDTLRYADGSIPLFNDSAQGVAPDSEQLQDYLARIGTISAEDRSASPFSVVLRDSGFARMQRGAALVFAEFGGPGPDYQPGHCHAGTNGFELALGDSRILVDSGISTYEVGEERLAQRSTAAHNTLELGGRNSSEVWSSFRVARRAKGRLLNWYDRPGRACKLESSHDGYRQLGIGGEHVRRWELDESSCTIEDIIDADARTPVRIYFHFHPRIRLSTDGDVCTIRDDQERVIASLSTDPNARTRIERYTCHHGFGHSEPAFRLVAEAVGETRKFRHVIRW